MNDFLRPEQVERIRQQYPAGTRICCDNMADDPDPIESGTVGKIAFVDDAGQIHVHWQNGRTLALVPEVDSFHIVQPNGVEITDIPAVRKLIEKLSDIADEMISHLETDIQDYDIDEMLSDDELRERLVGAVAGVLENDPKVDMVQVNDIGVQFQNMISVTPADMSEEQADEPEETEGQDMGM